MHAHFLALKKKKELLDKTIEQKQSQSWRDDVSIRTLKREKVYLNDELERLRRASS